MNNTQTFSFQSGQYAKHRPSYPKALFEYISGLVEGHALAWDCATGNGQAAISAADFFAQVAATDISEEQIRHRRPHPQVAYHICAAECAPFKANSFDAMLVAQAAHWFNLEHFYSEALRVLKPNGVLAVWGYGLFEIQPEIDAAIARDLLAPIDPYWAEGNRLLMSGYATLPFLKDEIHDQPSFVMTLEWTLAQLMEYLRTWSAVKRYVTHVGDDPVARLGMMLEALWGSPEQVRVVRMPLFLRIGRKPA